MNLIGACYHLIGACYHLPRLEMIINTCLVSWIAFFLYFYLFCGSQDTSTELFTRYFPLSHLPSVCLFFQSRSWFFFLFNNHPPPPPTHTHKINYAIFWRGKWHIRFASANLSYLAVLCRHSCCAFFFAPMALCNVNGECHTLYENAIGYAHTHEPTLLTYFILRIWQFLACSITWYMCVMFAHTEWFQNKKVAFIQIHVIIMWQVVYH